MNKNLDTINFFLNFQQIINHIFEQNGSIFAIQQIEHFILNIENFNNE